MDVFAFRDQVVAEYQAFTRSFTRINAKDIQDFVDREYQKQTFWPAPLIQLNPSFVSGGSVEALVSDGKLDPDCGRIFRFGKENGGTGTSLNLHRHQAEAIALAQARQSYVLTTGTGSGKSLTYILPIVDSVLRRRRNGDTKKRTAAIIVYPMNALCNSQLEELQKYLGLGFDQPLVTFARYTGQESQEERTRLSQEQPDILLTNYVMLELILTRQSAVDTSVIRGCEGLEFLVLDELHTYRGRQGADVAMLVRRVRERLNQELLCIGTSATMASEGTAADRAGVVAAVASKLFGAAVRPEQIITETLERVTEGDLPIEPLTLAAAVQSSLQGLPPQTQAVDLRHHPLAIWVELQLGLEREDQRSDGKWVRRSKPYTLEAAAQQLAQDSDLDLDTCQRGLSTFLLAAYQVLRADKRPFFAFRLHQFVTAAGDLLATVEPPEQRWLTLQGQEFKPGDRKRRLFPLCFCRKCGQEFYPVWASLENRVPKQIEPRELGDRSSQDEQDFQFGYFMPDASLRYDADSIEDAKYPDGWTEYDKDGNLALKSYYRKFKPVALAVNSLGQANPGGLNGWYLNGPFRFCPSCGEFHSSRKGEIFKLGRLSSEGRSSATTVLSLAVLQKLLTGTHDIPNNARKLLGFTDNRQDAALQAGHFNDFIQVLTLRSALISALDRHPAGQLREAELGQVVDAALDLPAAAFLEGGATAKPPIIQRARQTLQEVLAYRLYTDLRRGWRVTNPNLEDLKLLTIDYEYLVDCCADESAWRDKHPLLAQLPVDDRKLLIERLLKELRQGLAISSQLLDNSALDRLRIRAYDLLKPWGFEEEEKLRTTTTCIPRPYRGKGRKDSRFLYLSDRSTFGRWLKARERWIAVEPLYPPTGLKQADYERLVDELFSVLADWGLVERVDLDQKQTGYRLKGTALIWRRSQEKLEGKENEFFRSLYETTAALLRSEGRAVLQQLTAREHTAQVEDYTREEREEQFRSGELRLLYCSPTMELGVDIASLNTVYMRNVPPTPANYAQRSGRAGRSGQPALVVTYCAAQAPHDQYFFAEPTRMVAGAVSAPNLDIANRELLEAHLRAVWLAETGRKLPSSVKEILDLEQPDCPVNEEFRTGLDTAAARERALSRARRIIADIQQQLLPEQASLFNDQWIQSTIHSAYREFSRSFDRWRSLFQATQTQMNEATRIAGNPVANEQERKDADRRYEEAKRQFNLLLSNDARNNQGDFSTYRYLASQGFMPGYNFPRLPLLAYLPSSRRQVGQERFLSRPRFLGISEFGPQSLIYHEGGTYRVTKAILGVRAERNAEVNGLLPTQIGVICGACGHAHFDEDSSLELCLNCEASLAPHPEGEGRPLQGLYRIEQVSTTKAEQITSDEEERQRLGYELLTTYRFARVNNRLAVTTVQVEEGGETLLELQFGGSTTIRRINLGWKRRQNPQIVGFPINVTTGRWGNPDLATEEQDDEADEAPKELTHQRIVPYVEDTKNALVVKLRLPLETAARISFQYALKRAIETIYQLESNELACEPLPDRENCQALLFYEAAEGGAGVLSRLVENTAALQQLARTALELCHWQAPSGDWGDSTSFADQDPTCEAGCYRCLLSYQNQLDHQVIDRRNPELKQFLARLIHASLSRSEEFTTTETLYEWLMRNAGSQLERDWIQFLSDGGYHLPDRAQWPLSEYYVTPDFEYLEHCTLIFIDGPHHNQVRQQRIDAEKTQALEEAGYTVIRVGYDQSTWPGVIQTYSWIFGQGG